MSHKLISLLVQYQLNTLARHRLQPMRSPCCLLSDVWGPAEASQNRGCKQRAKCAIFSSRLLRLHLFVFALCRWSKSPNSGGSFAASSAMKATFHRESWRHWGATDSRPIRRYVLRHGRPPCWVTTTFWPLCSPPQPTSRGVGSPPTLDMTSSSPQVKAWLEYKGFSRMWDTQSDKCCRPCVCLKQRHLFIRFLLGFFFLHVALWTRLGCWLVNCFWEWPRMKYGQCVQRKEAKSSSSCRPSSHPSR